MLRSGVLAVARLTSSARLSSTAASAPMSFEKRLQELMADTESPLSQPEYALLQEKLAAYARLQGEYAVKQSEMERTKRVANVCGLDFPSPVRRGAPPANQQE